MGKMYTLDGKLLTELPELRVGDKLYPVDNRTCTVKKMMQLTTKKEDGENADYLESMGEAMTLALGQKAVAEINPDELPFPAYQELFSLVLAAATGEDPKKQEDQMHRFLSEADAVRTACRLPPGVCAVPAFPATTWQAVNALEHLQWKLYDIWQRNQAEVLYVNEAYTGEQIGVL